MWLTLHRKQLIFIMKDMPKCLQNWQRKRWGPVTRDQFDHLIGPLGAIVLGDPDQVAEKILRHSEALGGISRFQFQMDIADITHKNLLKSIELIGKEVIPRLNNLK